MSLSLSLRNRKPALEPSGVAPAVHGRQDRRHRTPNRVGRRAAVGRHRSRLSNPLNSATRWYHSEIFPDWFSTHTQCLGLAPHRLPADTRMSRRSCCVTRVTSRFLRIARGLVALCAFSGIALADAITIQPTSVNYDQAAACGE